MTAIKKAPGQDTEGKTAPKNTQNPGDYGR